MSQRARRRSSAETYLENVAARDVVVVQHITLGEHLLVPSRKVDLLGGGDANLGSSLNHGSLGLDGGLVDDSLGSDLATKSNTLDTSHIGVNQQLTR